MEATSKPFRTILCTGQVFATREEWSAWHNALGDAPALSHGGFDWNEASICMNPNKPIDHCLTANHFLHRVEVETAQCPCGAWNYGLMVNYGSGGFGFGVRFVPTPSEGYKTEKEAVIAGIKRVIEHLQREVDNPASDVGKKAEMLKVMQDYKERYCPLQPSLFDFDFD